MIGHVGVQGTNDGDIVDALAYVRKEFTDFDPTLPIAFKLNGDPIAPWSPARFSRCSAAICRAIYAAWALDRRYLPVTDPHCMKMWMTRLALAGK